MPIKENTYFIFPKNLRIKVLRQIELCINQCIQSDQSNTEIKDYIQHSLNLIFYIIKNRITCYWIYSVVSCL